MNFAKDLRHGTCSSVREIRLVRIPQYTNLTVLGWTFRTPQWQDSLKYFRQRFSDSFCFRSSASFSTVSVYLSWEVYLLCRIETMHFPFNSIRFSVEQTHHFTDTLMHPLCVALPSASACCERSLWRYLYEGQCQCRERKKKTKIHSNTAVANITSTMLQSQPTSKKIHTWFDSHWMLYAFERICMAISHDVASRMEWNISQFPWHHVLIQNNKHLPLQRIN